MKLPNPLAVSKQEAYLALLSQVLTDEQEAEIDKPSLEHPDTSFEAWLAFWAGKTSGQYPKDTERDEPLCLSDEEALVAYITGVTDIYPKTPQNPMDIRLSAYLRYLIDERYGRPEGGPVTTSEFYLSLMHPDIMTIPEPSSDFDLNWTTEAPLLDLGVNGDTKQNTLSGKNIFPLSIVTSGTGSGVTFTNNGDNLDIKGTATAGIDKGGFIPLTGAPANKFTSGQTYTLSVNKPLPTGVRVQVLFYTDSAWAADGLVMTGNGTITNLTREITIPNTATRVRYLVSITNGTAVDITDLKIMLTSSLANINSSANRTGGTAVVTKQSRGFKIGAGDSNFGYYGILMDKDAISSKGIKPSFGSSVAGAKVKFYYASTDGGSLTWLFSGRAFASGETVNMPDLSSYAQVYMVFYAGDNTSGTAGQTEVTYSDIIVEPVPNDFEPYCGGVASPNPDYPQAVNTVTGRQVVKVGGKNLFNIGAQYVMSNCSVEIEGDKVKITQQATGVGRNCFANFPIPNPAEMLGKKITVSVGSARFGDTSTGSRILIFTTDANKNPKSVIGELHPAENPGMPLTITMPAQFPSGIAGFSILFYANYANSGSPLVGAYSEYEKVQIEIGEEATAYTPYQNAEYELNLGKNLLDNKNPSLIGENVTWEPNDTGGGSLSAGSPTSKGIRWYFELEPGKSYTFSGKGSRNKGLFIADYPDSSFTTYKKMLVDNANMTGNYTIVPTTRYVCITYYAEAGARFTADNLQLEVGSTATPYAPYFDPIELCKLGSGDTVYQDVIFRNNPISEYFDQSLDLDKWYIKEMVGKVELSSFSWNEQSSAQGYYYRSTSGIPNVKYVSNNTLVGVGLAEKYRIRKAQGLSLSGGDKCIAIDTNTVRVNTGKTSGVIPSGKFCYALATPEIIPIEGELANQLDAIMEGGSYDIYTSFKVTSAGENLPALLMVACGAMSDENDLTKWIPTKKNPASWSA